MKKIIMSILISILIIVILLVISLLASKLPFYFNIHEQTNSYNILILSNHNGYMLENMYHNGVCVWAYYLLYEFIKRRFNKKSFKLYFKSIKRNTSINKFIKYLKKYDIRYIIPTESKNATYLSKHKKRLSKYVNMLVSDNHKIINELDDKYDCFLFCKKYNIPVGDTILITLKNIKSKVVNNFLEKYEYPYFLKKAYDSNGAQDVIKIDNYEELVLNLNKIKGRWILQEHLEPNHASIDILYHKGKTLSVTMHSHKWHTNMRSISNEYFFPTMYSLETHKSVPRKYVDDIMILVNKMGVHSNYTGIMNIDVLIHKEKPHLLEVNPRFSGSIYISMNTSLLKDYFKALLKNKFNNEPNIDYKESYITKASEVKNFSIVPFVIDHLGIILSVDKINIDTYAIIN